MNESKHRSPFAIVARLIVLVKPMLPIMLAAIVMGVAGHFCATFITIFGSFGILTAAGLPSPLKTVGTAFVCILLFALLRGVLRYAEQASNHYIAFKLLALIRDKVFGALRRLTPAKLEGRDRGDLISLITADIEALEVFYAHTISPICIAAICVIGMTCFVGSYHILSALVLLAGYLLVGVVLPIWSAKRGDRVAREYRQTLADTNSYVLESLRGLRDTLQYQDTDARAAGITAHSEALGEKQKALKYREGITVAPARFRDDLLPEELVQRHTVRSTDIDMGRHMNNVAYVRLLLDCFPASVLAGGEIASMEVHYAAPCFEGEELSVLCHREGSTCRMAVRKSDGKTAILAAVRFHEK